MEQARLVALDLGKNFFRKSREKAGDFAALSQVNLELHAGELVELAGRSGSGKSTLLNAMAGLLEPSTGKVLLDGRDLYALGDEELSRLRNERIGVVPQGYTALQSLTVAQNVTLPYVMYREAGDVESRAMDLLGQLGIAQLADAYPNELSGGELRRVAIARALICAPDVILADEPTGDLDDENTELVLEILRAAADGGAAVLLVTHEREAARFADRVLHMSAGVLA